MIRFFISLRYRVIVREEKAFREKMEGKQGILFLPNHTSHIDPLILFSWFWPRFQMRPLIVEFIAHFPLVGSFVRWGRGVLVPDFETSINQYKLRKAEKAVVEITKGLRKGDNFAIFPSGKFKSQGKEELGGSSAVHTILQEVPDAHIVLVRFSGLWGSHFSKALTGKSPHLMQTFREGVKNLFKNFLFFAPRRKVYIDLEADPVDFPRAGSRVDCNRFLEHWYNQYIDDTGHVHQTEPLKLIPDVFWSKKLPKVIAAPSEKRSPSTERSKEIEAKIYKEIRKILDHPDLQIAPDMSLGEDLGMDSLNIAEIVAYLFKNYSVSETPFAKLKKVEDLIELAEGDAPSKQVAIQGEKYRWPEEKGRPAPDYFEGNTLPEAFFNICRKMGSFSAMGDDVSGVISYKRCKKAVLVLAEAFRKMPEKHIALILPSSAGATLVIVALLCAGKVPVPLNWTLGPKYLEQMVALSGVKRVISSWRFMEKINFVDFGFVSDQIELLEDIRSHLTLSMKVKGIFHSLLSPVRILQKLQMDKLDENDPCVLLFTSGSESTPKGVPLSHKNILSTIRNCCWNLHGLYEPQDVMYGIMPQFHSFGFTNSTFTSLLCGMKVAFYPNPADSLALAEGIERWKITFLPLVPNFLKKIFDVAKKEQLKTLRFIITAGEKTPSALFDKVSDLKTGAVLLEGYGLTETSPVVALMRVGHLPKGVGQLFPNIEAITLHPETQEPLPKGGTGEVCVRGPNVFSGYLGKVASPFIEIDGKSWFRTGDLGYVDADRNLILTGRLKRFIKIAGEMISLEAIEETLNSACRKKGLIKQDTPSLAICPGKEDSEHPKLILFTVFPIELELANGILREAGFSNMIKIAKIQVIDDIPLMGTGKINYRELLSSLH